MDFHKSNIDKFRQHKEQMKAFDNIITERMLNKNPEDSSFSSRPSKVYSKVVNIDLTQEYKYSSRQKLPTSSPFIKKVLKQPLTSARKSSNPVSPSKQPRVSKP
jgi:hypothetical protein